MLFTSLTKTAALAAAALYPAFSSAQSSSTACNNSPSLCSKTYNNVTYLGAHDSPFLRDSTTKFSDSGNQYYNTTVQLSAGVRLLSAQVHSANGTNGKQEWHLCHSSCTLLDAGTLASWLSEIKSWMDKNTNEVVTLVLVNSDDASASELASEFSTSGIDEYAYIPASTSATSTWPTLQQMISNNTRLVTFVASLSSNTGASYLLDEFTYVFENPYEVTSASNFSCQPDRPSAVANNPTTASSSGRLFLMNHFLYEVQAFGIQTPNDNEINSTNAATGAGSLGNHAAACSSLYGKAPNFALVDFFNVGPAIASIDTLNGVTGATGRTTVSTAQLTASSTSAASKQDASAVALGIALLIAIVTLGDW